MNSPIFPNDIFHPYVPTSIENAIPSQVSSPVARSKEEMEFEAAPQPPKKTKKAKKSRKGREKV